MLEPAEIPRQRPVITSRRDDLDDGLVFLRRDQAERLDLVHEIEQVRHRLRVNVGVAASDRGFFGSAPGGKARAPGLGGQLRGQAKQHRDHHHCQPTRPEKFYECRRADPGQQDHAEIKIQQAPRRLVRNCGVDRRENDRVEREESQQRRFLSDNRNSCADDRQQQDQPFAPGRTSCRMKPREAFEIKTPRMNMRRMSARALEPRQVGARRIQQAGQVGEEGTEQQQPEEESRRRGQRGVFPVPESEQASDPGTLGQRPPDRDDSRESHRGEREDERFLGRKHQPHSCARQHGPAGQSRLRVTPARAQSQCGEKHQQHFVDEIAAVKNHGRGNGNEERGPGQRVAAQTIREKEEQKNQRDSERNRCQTQRGVIEFAGVARPAQPQERERGVMECRPMIFVRIVSVAAVLPQFADFDGIDRLVVVERAGGEVGNAEGERGGDGQQHRQSAPAVHLAGSAYTSSSCQQLSALWLPPLV